MRLHPTAVNRRMDEWVPLDNFNLVRPAGWAAAAGCCNACSALCWWHRPWQWGCVAHRPLLLHTSCLPVDWVGCHVLLNCLQDTVCPPEPAEPGDGGRTRGQKRKVDDDHRCVCLVAAISGGVQVYARDTLNFACCLSSHCLPITPPAIQ